MRRFDGALAQLPIGPVKLENIKVEKPEIDDPHSEEDVKPDISKIPIPKEEKIPKPKKEKIPKPKEEKIPKPKEEKADTKEDLTPFKGNLKKLKVCPVAPKDIKITAPPHNKKFNCNICQKGVGTKGGLIYHMKAHLYGRPFKCQICKKSYATKNDFNTHNKRHSGISYLCDLCGKSYIAKQYLADHVAQIHLPKIIPCPQCKTYLATNTMLKKHIFTTHKKKVVKLYKCKLCGVQCTKCSFAKHCALREKFKYKCVVCSKLFPCYLLWVEHRRQENAASFCDVCQRKVKSIKKHKYDHHGNFSCVICKSFTTDKSQLFYKHRSECGTKEKIAQHGFQCDVCNQSFDSSWKLLRHGNRAHGTLKCKLCSSTFISEVSLSTHYREHKKIKQAHFYVCVSCPIPKNYRSKVTFDAHFHSQHSGRIKRGGKFCVGRVCDKCGFRNKAKMTFLNHILICYKIKNTLGTTRYSVNLA